MGETDKKLIGIYNEIKRISDQLAKNGEVYSRADLSYELQEFGIKNDSFYVSKLVWDAYEFFHNDNRIKKVFLNNEGIRSLVEEYKLLHLMENDNTKEMFPLVYEILDNGKQTLDSLEELLSTTLTDVVDTVNKSDLMSYVKGTKGVSEVQAKANFLFDKYTLLVDTYLDAKEDVKIAVMDFVELRGYILDIYRRYTLKLIDVYGDSIKVIAPELFDFDAIQFLNVESMLKKIRLEYDQLSETCAVLMGEISDSFSKSLDDSLKGGNRMSDKYDKLILAGLTMVNHYIEAAERTTKSNQELEVFKQNIKHDVTTIKADYARLALIFKTLNDLYVPKANLFFQYSEQVLSNELKQLFDAIYQDPAIKHLAEEREATLAEIKKLEESLIDNRVNIDYYTQHIEKCNALILSKTNEYDEAKRRKPSKPFFLINWITMGTLNKSYYRDMYEWNAQCAPVISEFENCKMELKLDNDELTVHNKLLNTQQDEMQGLQLKLKNLNQKINEKIRVSDQTKQAVLQHLEPIIKLLRIAKDITESKLDERYIRSVNISDYRDTELSEATQNNISRFVGELQLTPSLPESESEIDLISEQVAQRSVELFEKWAQLKALQLKGSLINKAYDIELEKLQHQFNQDLATVDNQADLLTAILKKVRTAHNTEEIKEGLMLLLGNDESIKKADLKQFINGIKTIEI